MNQQRVVIIGGGITGLTAAFTLKQMFGKGEIHCTILESSSRIGGKVYTLREDNLVLDLGPDSIIDSQQSAVGLIRDLGVNSEIVYADPTVEKVYLLANQKLTPLPYGTVLGVPSILRSIWQTSLVSYTGKLRVLADYFTPRTRDNGSSQDQSLGLFLRRRLGNEWVDQVCEPFLASASGAKIDDLSLEATFPELLQLEQQYGSLLKGVRQWRTSHAVLSTEGGRFTIYPGSSSPTSQPPIFTLKNGLQTLTEQLFDGLRHFAEIRTDTSVTKIQRFENGQYGIEMTSDETTETMVADVVILSTSASVAGQLLCSLSAKAAKLSAIRYVSTATVMLGYPAGALPHFTGTGFIAARNETTGITACEIVSKRWPHTTTDGRVLIRCDVGRSGQTEWLAMDDATLIRNVESQLQQVLQTEGKPWFTKVLRWDKAIPQYEVGHSQLTRDVETALQTEAPGIFIAGAGYYGMGLSECIANGKSAANRAGTVLNPAKRNTSKQNAADV